MAWATLLMSSLCAYPALSGNVVTSFNSEVAPLIEDLCADCHMGKKQKGGVSFEGFDHETALLSQRELWRKVREALVFGNMPPKSETQPKPEERTRLIHWIETNIETPDPNNPLYLDPGPTILRQLSRDEYRRTVTDLFGLGWQDPASQAGIPQERPVEGFTNLAGGLNIDPALLEKYFHAAEISLERFLSEGRERNAIFFVKADEGKGISPQAAASQVLQRFMAIAYRRPVADHEWQRLLPLFDRAIADGASFELAVSRAMKPILSSPHFFYRIEKPASDEGKAYQRVTNHELAVRLSYFLWSSMPDQTLREIADRGDLQKPEVLKAEVTRMLTHDKARALTENFGVQWLKLRKLDRALPQQNAFPSFNGDLKRAMHDEVFTFFETLRKENRSVRELIDSDYTFVNEVLAKHYGIAGISGTNMQRVSLKPEHHRGGLLGMAGILAATSHTDRTKPTARGTWILDVLFGTPPSPPPENAGTLEEKKKEDQPEPASFRERLNRHASDESCAGCHKKMDPLGFALENYDGIGSWRTSVGDQPVDNVGTLPDGESFTGIDGLKAVLHAREKVIIRNFIRQILVYAMGREAEFYDELAVGQIAAAAEANGYRFADIAAEIARSLPFQNKRVAKSQP